jgi:hypothetical protein
MIGAQTLKPRAADATLGFSKMMKKWQLHD